MLSSTCVWVKNFFLFFCVRAIFYEPHDASLGTMYRIENSLNVCRRLTVGENSNVSGCNYEGMRNRKDKKWARNLLFNYHSHEVSHPSTSNRMPGIPIHDWRSIHNHLHKTKIKLNWIGKVTLAGSLRNTRQLHRGVNNLKGPSLSVPPSRCSNITNGSTEITFQNTKAFINVVGSPDFLCYLEIWLLTKFVFRKTPSGIWSEASEISEEMAHTFHVYCWSAARSGSQKQTVSYGTISGECRGCFVAHCWQADINLSLSARRVINLQRMTISLT